MSPKLRTVIIVGPSRTMTGGMSTVVGQMAGLAFGGRYRPVPFPVTMRSEGGEPLAQRFGRHFRRLRALRGELQNSPDSIVHLHTCSGFSFHRSLLDMGLAQFAGARIILHIHGASFDQFCARAGRAERTMIGRGLCRADRVVVLSRTWRDTLHRIAPRACLEIIENAVELPDVAPRHAHDGPLRLLMLATMDRWKGVDDLLAASEQLLANRLAFQLVLAGPPGSMGDADMLDAEIARRNLGACVEYVGTVSGTIKSRWFQWADVLVQPSHHEGMPIALLEALAHGLPVVATTVGAIPEVMTDGVEGLLVPSKCPPRLATAITELARKPQLRDEMSLRARNLAERRFSLPRLEQDLISLYDGL